MSQKSIEELLGIKILKRPIFDSDLGTFSETYRMNNFSANFIQDSFSISYKKNTIRGMHFQKNPFCQEKLVTVLNGSIEDFIVDLRKDSATYQDYASIEISKDNGQMLYIPEGFAHGFKTLEDNTYVFYKLSKYYSPEHEFTLKWNDSTIGIDWNVHENFQLSDKDKHGKLFEIIEKHLNF
jgi:dTDP-4-dehydrorhamnose 3,5-epimerase